MNELALFAGVGGGILAGHLLGWRTVCAVECNAYASSVLCARQNDGFLAPFPVWDDIRTFDGKPWRGRVDVVSGGFPCQDISIAGTGKGLDGERSGLWREMARVIREVRPRYAFVENSPMLVARGLGRVLADLAALGFDARWGVLGAADVGSPHQRDRLWIVAHSDMRRGRPNVAAGHNANGHDAGRQETHSEPATGALHAAHAYGSRESQPQGCQPDEWRWFGDRASEDADLDGIGWQGRSWMLGPRGRIESPHGDPAHANTRGERLERSERSWASFQAWCEAIERRDACGWWAAEPDVVRMVHGIPARVDRITGLGNAQVPAVAAAAWRALQE